MSTDLVFLFIAGITLLIWALRRTGRTFVPFYASLDTVLLKLGRRDRFTIRDACEGIAVFGGTGSGKTSGSGLALDPELPARRYGRHRLLRQTR